LCAFLIIPFVEVQKIVERRIANKGDNI
jgi:hypothetical protein